jgi:hypothetical protein
MPPQQPLPPAADPLDSQPHYYPPPLPPGSYSGWDSPPSAAHVDDRCKSLYSSMIGINMSGGH